MVYLKNATPSKVYDFQAHWFWDSAMACYSWLTRYVLNQEKQTSSIHMILKMRRSTISSHTSRAENKNIHGTSLLLAYVSDIFIKYCWRGYRFWGFKLRKAITPSFFSLPDRPIPNHQSRAMPLRGSQLLEGLLGPCKGSGVFCNTYNGSYIGLWFYYPQCMARATLYLPMVRSWSVRILTYRLEIDMWPMKSSSIWVE